MPRVRLPARQSTHMLGSDEPHPIPRAFQSRRPAVVILERTKSFWHEFKAFAFKGNMIVLSKTHRQGTSSEPVTKQCPYCLSAIRRWRASARSARPI